MLYIDIETRSRQVLKDVGVYRYTECPDFRILMASWAHDDDETQTALGHDEICRIPGLWDPRVRKAAHNAQFERVCFSILGRGILECEPNGYLDPEPWHDTQALAAEYGHPVSLDGAARAVGASLKDTAGKRLINLFCVPNRQGEFNQPEDYPLEWIDFIAYCEQDVETLREVAAGVGDWPTDIERRTWEADQRINDRGMQIDIEMARLAQQESENNKIKMIRESKELTGLDNPNSIQQLKRWLTEQGFELPDMRAETVEEVLAGEDAPPLVRQVLELRQELALAAASKYATAVDTSSPDGRVRGGFRFFGAHTGRWAGRGLQPHNLPRAAFKTEVEAEATILDLKMGAELSQLDLKKLVRPLFTGPFTVVDYASIEARVIAWLAGEEWALQAFRDGRDIYVETAERMGGLTRAQGKVAVLALGYAGGLGSLRAMGADGDDQDLLNMVAVWRRANRNIVKMWADLDNAVEEGGRIGEFMRVRRYGSNMAIELPSGRAIHYHHLRHEKYVVVDSKTGRKIHKQSWRYQDPKKPQMRISTYGGRLAENVTQAVARDLLAEALVRLHERGYPVAAHVHDEILVEGRYDPAEIAAVMCESPEWAPGLPIDGEGFQCNRYRKG